MSDEERRRRWRLVLGPGEGHPLGVLEDPDDVRRDAALGALYDTPAGARRGGLGASAPQVARWVEEVRALFPTPVVRVVQADALERLGLARMLLEPELLAHVEPDVRLAAALLALRGALPARAREAARAVVRRCVEDLERRLGEPLRASVRGALRRAARTRRPRPAELDWPATLRANLRHHRPELGAPVPERWIGRADRRRGLREVMLLLDQSASMAGSAVHAGVLGATLASLPALTTRALAFDTAVVDLTDHLGDPVELLFGLQLGGGTDLGLALAAALERLERPADTAVFLISDLLDGGPRDRSLGLAARLVRSGARLVVLLAIGDDGAPVHDAERARAFAAMGATVLAATPDQLPAVLAAALEGRPIPAAAPAP